MRVFDKVDAAGMKKVVGEISKSKASIVKLDSQEVKFTDAINREKEKFDRLKAQGIDLDQDELTDARFALRPQMENEGYERIRKGIPDGRISFAKYQAAVKDADRALMEDGMDKRYREHKRDKEPQKKNKENQESGTLRE